ncbi:restriction endonuclease subunit S [Pseudoalteromonas sp. SG43-3]|uniref:restriction endonuclease subunit S n=1 Tax=Pseudoalteromonas sp. SG43-3 TaxID=2760970 RepID=UPI00160131A3|nr:restriction endonuclease subunit S [Pseudoalteromonas sp. SG43-3]MBB1445282.1 restriction endonuclease subunit S [Pseudoalteromonas sp. SG43-3]
MYYTKVLSSLDDRLDAEFYNPEALRSIQRMKDVGEVVTLGSLISEGYRVVYHGTDSINGLDKSQLLPFLSPTQIDKEGAISFEITDQLPMHYRESYPKGLAKEGELLVEVKGNVAKVAVVPSIFPKNLMVSGSLYKASIDSSKADIHYVLAFLKSANGQVLKNRLTSNTIINYIAKEALYSIPVFKISMVAQRYIGNKVRQAEAIRIWAKSVEKEVTVFHQQFIPSQNNLNFNKKFRRVKTGNMTERFDAHFYPAVVDDYFADKEMLPLSNLGKIAHIFNGQTQPESSNTNTCEQITVTNLSPTFLIKEPRVVVAPGSKDKFTHQHDLLMCNAAHNKAYIGRDLTYCSADIGVLPSTEVMVIRVNRNFVPASYIRTYLLSKVGNVQIQSTIRGITAHSYPNDVATLEIPLPVVPNELNERWFAMDNLLAQAGLACEIATKLNATAKLLVEALIKGTVNEAELTATQEALDGGEDSLERILFKRINTDGVDGEGEQLFDDIDQIYDLLAQVTKEMQEA